MTAPNQVAPDGSYTIGGGQYRFGQALQEDMVRNLLMSGLRGISIGNIGDAVPLVEMALRKVPLDALKMTKPFLLGATDADFADVNTAVDFIMKTLKVREVFMTLAQAQKLLDDLVKSIVKIFTGHEGGLDVLEQWWKDIAGLLGLLGNPDQLIAKIQDLLNKVWGFLTGTLTHPDKTLSDVVDALGNWLTNTFDVLKASVDQLWVNLRDLVDGILNLFGITGVGHTVQELVDQIKAWLDGPFKLVQDGVTGVVKKVQDLLDGLLKLFGGTGIGHSVQDVLTQISGWLTTTFKPVADAVTAITKIVQDLLDGLGSLFGGADASGLNVTNVVTTIKAWLDGPFSSLKTAVDTVTATVTQVTAWIQTLIDGIFTLFGGAAGSNKSAAEAIAAITTWLNGPFKALTSMVQQIVDGLTSLFGGADVTGQNVVGMFTTIKAWLDGPFSQLNALIQQIIDAIAGIWNPGAGTGNPIQGIIDAIGGIFGIANNAMTAANNANIAIAAAGAADKNGFSDEFDYASEALMAANWNHTGANVWKPIGGLLAYTGPKGSGGLIPAIGLHAEEVFVEKTNPLPGNSGSLTVVLSKPPFYDGLVQSHVYPCGQCSLTDKSCIRWEVGAKSVQFQTVNAAGTATNVGAAVPISTLQAGATLEMVWTATQCSLKINTQTVATRTYTALPGTHIGLVMATGPYTWTRDHPAAELRGAAWHP